jgi:energy-coupling factor transport system permease protein
MRMTLGQYLPRESIVHKLDPRVKLFLMGLSIGVTFQLDSVLGLFAFALSCIAFTLLSKIPLKSISTGLAPFLWLFLFTALLHVFMTPGDPIIIPYATQQGLVGGVRVACQLIFAIWISTLTTLTTSPLDTVWALEWYLKPLKYMNVPTDEIALVVMLAIRFIPLLFEETDRIIKAQKARGIDLESPGLVHKVRSLVPVLVPLLHSVFRRADDLAVALTLRGYTPGTTRTRMKEMVIHSGDIMALAGVSFWFMGLLILS